MFEVIVEGVMMFLIIVLFLFLDIILIIELGIPLMIFSSYNSCESYQKRIERRKLKLQKVLQKKLQKKIKRCNCINYEALKFEYHDLCKIIEKEIEKIKKTYSCYVVSELYLVNMHNYLKTNDMINLNKAFSIEFLSSFYEVIKEEPILININSKNKYDKLNTTLIENVIKAINYQLSNSKHAEQSVCLI